LYCLVPEIIKIFFNYSCENTFFSWLILPKALLQS
jgi:hypothetical protein